jgi:hypothetical protein
MRESARGGARRFGYDTTRFVEAVKNKQLAFERVRDAIDASSATNPLFLICAGPMEVCWQGANMANPQKRAFVTAISHSLWNDKHADTDHNGHHWDDLGHPRTQAGPHQGPEPGAQHEPELRALGLPEEFHRCEPEVGVLPRRSGRQGRLLRRRNGLVPDQGG